MIMAVESGKNGLENIAAVDKSNKTDDGRK